MRSTYFYLVKLQFLGFRYSGWQKQPHQKTIESMLVKTLKYILPKREFKILGAGRTDAKVSAMDAAFELYLNNEPIEDLKHFIEVFNYNLPPDIKIINCHEVDKRFNIIKNCIEKEYTYLFSHGTKNHPFSAPFITGIQEELDIELMTKGASLFIGTHSFKVYTTSDSTKKRFERTIDTCKIVPNDLLKANFFPDMSYALIIKSKGFLRYQVRMIMGALIQLGKHELSLEQIRSSLQTNTSIVLTSVAPASGLMLHSLSFSAES